MTREELKTVIVTDLLEHLSDAKPLLESNEQVASFYRYHPNGKKELNDALDEVYEELVEKYNINTE